MQRKMMKVKPLMQSRFQSLQELIQHFENRLSMQEIENGIRETGQLFICHGKATEEAERSLFILRCSEALRGSLLLHEEELIGDLPNAGA